MSLKKIAIDLLHDTSKYSPLQKKCFYNVCEDLLSGKSIKKYAQDISDLDLTQDIFSFSEELKKTSAEDLPEDLLSLPLEKRAEIASKIYSSKKENSSPLVKFYAEEYDIPLDKLNLTKVANLLEVGKYSVSEENKNLYKIATQTIEHVTTKKDLVKIASLLEQIDGASGVKRTRKQIEDIMDSLEFKKVANEKVIIESYTLDKGKVQKAYKEVMGEALKESDDVQAIVKALPKPDRIVIAKKAQ